MASAVAIAANYRKPKYTLIWSKKLKPWKHLNTGLLVAHCGWRWCLFTGMCCLSHCSCPRSSLERPHTGSWKPSPTWDKVELERDFCTAPHVGPLRRCFSKLLMSKWWPSWRVLSWGPCYTASQCGPVGIFGTVAFILFPSIFIITH